MSNIETKYRGFVQASTEAVWIHQLLGKIFLHVT
jgi:hypothetical protein